MDAMDMELTVSSVRCRIHIHLYASLSGNGPNCATAFFAPEDWNVQRACQVDNVRALK